MRSASGPFYPTICKLFNSQQKTQARFIGMGRLLQRRWNSKGPVYGVGQVDLLDASGFLEAGGTCSCRWICRGPVELVHAGVTLVHFKFYGHFRPAHKKYILSPIQADTGTTNFPNTLNLTSLPESNKAGSSASGEGCRGAGGYRRADE